VLDGLALGAERVLARRALITRQRAQDAMSATIEVAGSIRDFKVVRVALDAI
jgi:phosphoribosyl-dephospho-CoA transferase